MSEKPIIEIEIDHASMGPNWKGDSDGLVDYANQLTDWFNSQVFFSAEYTWRFRAELNLYNGAKPIKRLNPDVDESVLDVAQALIDKHFFDMDQKSKYWNGVVAILKYPIDEIVSQEWGYTFIEELNKRIKADFPKVSKEEFTRLFVEATKKGISMLYEQQEDIGNMIEELEGLFDEALSDDELKEIKGKEMDNKLGRMIYDLFQFV
jgi:hypothetical protein